MEAHYIGFNMWVKAVENLDERGVQCRIAGLDLGSVERQRQAQQHQDRDGSQHGNGLLLEKARRLRHRCTGHRCRRLHSVLVDQ
jgi:hypothetical protein